jgi:hypothetical protein
MRMISLYSATNTDSSNRRSQSMRTASASGHEIHQKSYGAFRNAFEGYVARLAVQDAGVADAAGEGRTAGRSAEGRSARHTERSPRLSTGGVGVLTKFSTSLS